MSLAHVSPRLKKPKIWPRIRSREPSLSHIFPDATYLTKPVYRETVLCMGAWYPPSMSFALVVGANIDLVT